MNQIRNLKKLTNLGYFNNIALLQLTELSRNSLYANTKRWLQKGEIFQLKKGLYVTREYLLKQRHEGLYKEFIANKLREPSYLSLEYVLQKHGIMTESVFAYTSITLKAKRIYQNNLGSFIYRNIREGLFTGYTIKTYGAFAIREAGLVKALFDYLYLKTFRTKDIGSELIRSYRLNLASLSKKDLKEFARYCKMAKTKKLMILNKLIGEIHDT